MASEADIWRGVRADLRRILLTVPGVSSYAWEGRDLTPTTGMAWLRDRIDKGGAVPRSYRVKEEAAIYVADLNWPRQSSFGEGEEIAHGIAAAFYPDRAITALHDNYQFGRVRVANVRTAIMFDAWAQFPVRVEFWFRHRF